MDENAIRERLRGDLRRYEAPPRELGQVIRRAGRLRFLRVFVAAAVGGLMVIGIAGPLLVLSSIQGPLRRPVGTGTVNPTVTADVAVGDFPSAIAVGDGSVWVAVQSRAGGENVVARIDPATNEVTERIPVGGLPEWVTIGDGSLWIGLPGAVQRVDPETGEPIAEIRGAGGEVTFASGAVWAVASATSLARIDPSTNQVVATVPLDLPGGYIIRGPIATTDAVWVIAALESESKTSGVASGQLLRIDPNTNSVVDRIDLEVASSALAVGDGAVWTARWGADRTYLTRIDTGTNQADVPIVVEGGWTPFGVGAGRLWLMGGTAPEIRLAWLDLAELRLEGSIVVAKTTAFDGSAVFDPATDSVWVLQEEEAITRVDLGPSQSSTPMVARCVQARTSGDFDGDGTTDDAQFVEVASGSVSCDRSGEGFENLSSQELEIRFGSGQALEKTFTDCQGGLCAYVFASTDLDGDSRDELAIDVSSGATGLVEFYRVDPDRIRPLAIAEPGDRPYVEPGPAILGGGFDSALQSPVICKANDDGTRELVAIHAENVGNSLSGPWEVHRTTMVLRGERLVVTSASDSRSSFPETSGTPSFSEASPFENGCS